MFEFIIAIIFWTLFLRACYVIAEGLLKHYEVDVILLILQYCSVIIYFTSINKNPVLIKFSAILYLLAGFFASGLKVIDLEKFYKKYKCHEDVSFACIITIILFSLVQLDIAIYNTVSLINDKLQKIWEKVFRQ